MRRSRCRLCGTEIRYAITNRGRRMPMELDPDPDGTYALDLSDTRNEIRVRLVDQEYREAARQELGLYQCHWDVCEGERIVRGAA